MKRDRSSVLKLISLVLYIWFVITFRVVENKHIPWQVLELENANIKQPN